MPQPLSAAAAAQDNVALVQLNYNMPFNNLAPSLSNRNLRARIFAILVCAFSANRNRKRIYSEYTVEALAPCPCRKTCSTQNKKINRLKQQEQQQQTLMKIYFRFLIESNS